MTRFIKQLFCRHYYIESDVNQRKMMEMVRDLKENEFLTFYSKTKCEKCDKEKTIKHHLYHIK